MFLNEIWQAKFNRADFCQGRQQLQDLSLSPRKIKVLLFNWQKKGPLTPP
jgi:hypothetical protein